jgi:integrase/recombinase XerD
MVTMSLSPDMVKRRALAAGLSTLDCKHTFPVTRITSYLEAGATIEEAQQGAANESPTTTKLYNRTEDPTSLDESEQRSL